MYLNKLGIYEKQKPKQSPFGVTALTTLGIPFGLFVPEALVQHAYAPVFERDLWRLVATSYPRMSPALKQEVFEILRRAISGRGRVTPFEVNVFAQTLQSVSPEVSRHALKNISRFNTLLALAGLLGVVGGPYLGYKLGQKLFGSRRRQRR